MIEMLSNFVPTMEHAMQGSVVFAAIAHGVDTIMKRVKQWFADRRYAKWEAEIMALPAEVETKVEEIKSDVETTVKKSKKNG